MHPRNIGPGLERDSGPGAFGGGVARAEDLRRRAAETEIAAA